MKNVDLHGVINVLTNNRGCKHFPMSKLIGSGNTKVPSTTAIFNMSPASCCPSFKLGLCKAYSPDGKHVCYALKCERSYRPDVLPYRIEQMKLWKNITAEEFFFQFICINDQKAYKGKPWDKLRFNEAGDFHSQECLDKADTIASYLNRYGIKSYCYTHRSDLDYSKLRNLIVSGSNFQKAGIPNTFKMVEDLKDKPKGWSVCAGDCRICDKCSKRGNKIVVKRH